ncbi:hypothetical protein [Aquabacterium sp.]|uniref:hypothetical protein n=1 Tax=Aquabacterium sp. TaxID=1872578 RepID=UPI0040382172
MQTLRPSIVTLSVVALLMTGCASTRRPDPQIIEPYCLKDRLGRTTMCTTTAAPSLAREAEVKRFVPDARVLTVFVVRNSWGDTRHRLSIRGTGTPEPELIPRSFARLTLPPGQHHLSFELDGQVMTKAIHGQAGDVVFVAIDGAAWAWGNQYRWSDESVEKMRDRVLKARLVFDR